MASKGRLYRIIEMINLLGDRHRKWKAKKLAEHFSVSKRTIYRDFQIMDEMRIPIYQEENHTYSILDDFYFNPPEITREEALAVLLVSQAFHEEMFPYQSDLDAAISKIINSLPDSIKKVVDDLGKEIVYHHGAVVNAKEYKDIIQIIEKSIKDNMSLIIKYYSLSRDEESKRKINPYQVFHMNGAFYLIAYCHLRSEVLMFRIDRIRHISTTTDRYEEDESFDIEEYLKTAWGVERSNVAKRVVLVFKGKSARLVREKKWHDSQEVIELPGDKIRFEVTTGSMEEMKSWVLSFGASVEVIRPEELKLSVKEEIEKMGKIYERN
ncbi:MAG: helix-turn-helix transcriptional regulator, partial [Halanaerobiales bacterium]